jgi:TRAP-type C4-dicarboxylate transport system substrate-binding protein
MSRIDRVRLGMGAGVAALLMTAAQPALAQETFNWRFGIYFPSVDSLEGQHAQEFVTAVAERSDNRLQIEIFPGGLLGFSSFTHHRVVGDGLLEMGTTMSAAMVDAPEWETLSHALLFRNREEAQTAWDIARPELEAAAARDFNGKVLGATMAEFDHMLSKRPLPAVESWKGLKFRAWQKQLGCWFEQMGATPMVIPYHETYTALATGQVEGNSGGLQAAMDVKLHEVTDYVSTGWTPNVPFYVTLVNEDAWQSLPGDLQQILAEESGKYFAATTDAYWQRATQNLELLVENGMEEVAVPEEEFAKGRGLARVCWDRWRSETTPEAVALMDKILAGLED